MIVVRRKLLLASVSWPLFAAIVLTYATALRSPALMALPSLVWTVGSFAEHSDGIRRQWPLICGLFPSLGRAIVTWYSGSFTAPLIAVGSVVITFIVAVLVSRTLYKVREPVTIWWPIALVACAWWYPG